MLPVAVLQAGLVAVLALSAVRFGGGYERLGATILLANSACGWMAEGSTWPAAAMVGQAGDAAALAAFLLLALRGNRFWLLWAAGFQLAAVLQQHLRQSGDAIRPVSLCAMSLLLLVITVHRPTRTR